MLLAVLTGILLLACQTLTGADPNIDFEEFEEVSDGQAPDSGQAQQSEASSADNQSEGLFLQSADTGLSINAGSFFSVECPFDIPPGVEMSCGVLTVPENRTLTSSPLIELAVAIVSAPDGSEQEPLVYLAGGPGGSAIDEFLNDVGGFDYPFTKNRDLILVDQRGTGYSSPTLNCPEMEEEGEFLDDNPQELCQQRLATAGIDLTAYNSAENAADIATLRQALNIDEWNLMGISYGTRLALTVMRDYPEGIRSVILDSVFPPDADTPGEEALSTLWSLRRLFDECESDAYCSEQYPNLQTVFLETVADLNESPQDETYGDDLVFAISNAFNDGQLISLVPYVIYAVSEGDIAALDEISADGSGNRRYQQLEDRSDSEGMFNSVICHEEYIFGDYATAEAVAESEAPEEIQAALLQPVADQFQVCSYWGAGRAAAIENDPVFSDIPALILAGQYDVATPLPWAYQTSQSLANDFLFEFPGNGHALLSGNPCAISITDAFLSQPGQEPPSDCLAEIDWPYFE